ncbi:hypothetical protein [Companilactobacillus ginsenosidimutans]|uniref:Uncharacterized protein n=1 Tax=Companilactobacillus ginsenosidimutans TaxID=1007676 RepID=A0A0H4QXS3_9LACO|nr:hypothetical protein [Companilactobacillus ginsenosidimutans]AKP66275.1 hypothetical protein ABM34_01060 [Companilactobacillus ginsenosidimutans]
MIESKPQTNISEREINNNKINWDKGTSSLKVVKDKSTITDLASFPTSLDKLKKDNDYVIQGTIIDLDEMTDYNENAMTKATILVDNVISGGNGIQDHTIKVVFTGGVTENSKSQQVYVNRVDAPIPEIGSKIITGIRTNRSQDTTDKKYAKYLKTNKLGGSDTFKISVPEYNIWVKNDGEKKYSLNNPELNGKKTSDSNKEIADKLQKLTDILNDKYNK